jgi:hypothetical protein
VENRWCTATLLTIARRAVNPVAFPLDRSHAYRDWKRDMACHLIVFGGSKARDGSQRALKKAPSRESIAASIARECIEVRFMRMTKMCISMHT